MSCKQASHQTMIVDAFTVLKFIASLGSDLRGSKQLLLTKACSARLLEPISSLISAGKDLGYNLGAMKVCRPFGAFYSHPGNIISAVHDKRGQCCRSNWTSIRLHVRSSSSRSLASPQRCGNDFAVNLGQRRHHGQGTAFHLPRAHKPIPSLLEV